MTTKMMTASKAQDEKTRKGESVRTCRVAYATHIGTRPKQEDALFVDGLTILPTSQRGMSATDAPIAAELECTTPCVFAVADGLGGQNAGDVASETCIRLIADQCKRLPPDIALRDAVEAFQRLIHSTSMQLRAMASKDTQLRDMGTTLVVLLACNEGCAVLSIGDSRAYILSGETLHVVTSDDTEGQRLLDLELISPDELDGINDRGRLVRYVGMGQPGLIVRAREHVIALDGRILLLLCSDGLSRMLSTNEMEAILSDDESLVVQAISMVSAAANREDSDNTSAILVRIG